MIRPIWKTVMPLLTATYSAFDACRLRGTGCSMPTRLPSVSVKETYCPTPVTTIGLPSTFPPASVTIWIEVNDAVHFSSSIGCCFEIKLNLFYRSMKANDFLKLQWQNYFRRDPIAMYVKY
jgi:hypothetical protein